MPLPAPVERTMSFFIHFSPALVSWTMRWRLAGAPLFGLPASEPAVAVDAAAFIEIILIAHPLTLYLSWWLAYGSWLLSIGYRLPEQGWGRSSFMDMRPTIQKSLGIPAAQKRLQACGYLLVHACLSCAVICLLPPLLYHSFALHTAFLLGLLCSAAWRGACYCE